MGEYNSFEKEGIASMPPDFGLPTYEELKLAADASNTPETLATGQTALASKDGADATIVYLCHFDKSKPKPSTIAFCPEAVLIPHTMSQVELLRLLHSRVVKRQDRLKITVHDHLYALCFFDDEAAGKDTVTITDEETWQACRVLLKERKASKLFFYAFVKAKAPAEGVAKTSSIEAGKESRRSSKKCAVQ